MCVCVYLWSVHVRPSQHIIYSVVKAENQTNYSSWTCPNDNSSVIFCCCDFTAELFGSALFGIVMIKLFRLNSNVDIIIYDEKIQKNETNIFVFFFMNSIAFVFYSLCRKYNLTNLNLFNILQPLVKHLKQFEMYWNFLKHLMKSLISTSIFKHFTTIYLITFSNTNVSCWYSVVHNVISY